MFVITESKVEAPPALLMGLPLCPDSAGCLRPVRRPGQTSSTRPRNCPSRTASPYPGEAEFRQYSGRDSWPVATPPSTDTPGHRPSRQGDDFRPIKKHWWRSAAHVWRCINLAGPSSARPRLAGLASRPGVRWRRRRWGPVLSVAELRPALALFVYYVVRLLSLWLPRSSTMGSL